MRPVSIFTFEQGELTVVGLQAALNQVMRDGFAAAAAASGHAGAADGVSADGGRDCALVVFGPAMDECDVGFLDLASCELRGHLAMGSVVFGDYDEAAGFFVEAVNDTGAQVAANFGEWAETMQQGVDQGAAIAVGVGGSGAGVHHHTGGLVDDGEVFVFVNNIEWNFFGDGAQGRAFYVAEDFDFFAAAQVEGGLGAFSID